MCGEDPRLEPESADGAAVDLLQLFERSLRRSVEPWRSSTNVIWASNTGLSPSSAINFSNSTVALGQSPSAS